MIPRNIVACRWNRPDSSIIEALQLFDLVSWFHFLHGGLWFDVEHVDSPVDFTLLPKPVSVDSYPSRGQVACFDSGAIHQLWIVDHQSEVFFFLARYLAFPGLDLVLPRDSARESGTVARSALVEVDQSLDVPSG